MSGIVPSGGSGRQAGWSGVSTRLSRRRRRARHSAGRGGQTDVGRARRPAPRERRKSVRARESSLEHPPRQDPSACLRTTSAHNHSRRTHMSGLPKHTEAQNAPPTENTSSIRFVHSLRAHRGDPKIFCIEPFKTGSPGYIGETPLSRAADSASFRSRSLT